MPRQQLVGHGSPKTRARITPEVPIHLNNSSCNDPDPNVTLCLWDLHQAELVYIQPEAREASSKPRMIGLGAIAGYVERHREPQTYFVDHFNVWRRCVHVEGEGCQELKNRIGEVDAGTTACTSKLQL
ncbi:hypothetical protein GE21DRAFT_1349503, partial [Neurospora crassa]